MRACARRTDIDEKLARSIIASQATRPQRLAVADDVLINEAPLEEIQRRVEHLHRTYVRSAATKRSSETL